MAGTNDYLGLSRHPRVIEAATEALGRYGASVTGARCLNGTIELHERLEARTAEFLGQPAAFVATSRYHAGLALATAMGSKDVAFMDTRNHASLTDGLRLGTGTLQTYRYTDPAHLRRRLAAVGGNGGRLVVTDGVFPMEGDVAPLSELREVADEFQAKLVVDSAHDFASWADAGPG